MNKDSQATFLFFLFQNREHGEALGFPKMQDKKNIPSNLPPNFFQKFKDLPPLW